MLSYQVINYYEFIKKELDRFGETLVPLFEWVEEYKKFITTTSVQVLKSSVSYSGTTKTYSVTNGKIKENYTEIVRKFKSSFLSYTVFNSFGEFKQKIIEYKKQNKVEQNDYIVTLFKETDELFATYQLFQQDDIEQEKFINFANKLIVYKDLYNNSKIMYSDYMSLENNTKILDKKTERALKIQLLDVEYSLTEFSNNLKYIDEVYYEIGNLIYADSVAISYQKLRIIKIESGSLFSEVFGNKNIIDVFVMLIKKSIRWVQNKYESGEEIERHTKLAEALKKDVEIMQMLEENGCDVRKSKPLVEKAFNVVAKDLLQISQSASKIKINDEEFCARIENRNNYLNEVKVKKIGDSKLNE